MSISLVQFLTDLKKEDILEDLLDFAQTAGLPVTAWQSGEFMHSVMSLFSGWFERIWNLFTLPIVRVPFLDWASTANEQFLEIFIEEFYGVERTAATFARGAYLLTNEDITPYTINVGDLRVRNSLTGKTYTNSTGGFLAGWSGSGDFPTLELEIVADEIGFASSASGGEIDTLVTAFPGVVGTNESAIVGQDKQSLESLVETARASVAANSVGGPKLAHDYYAKNTFRLDGTKIDINRTKIPTPPGDGTATLYVASPSGAVSAPDVALIQTAITQNSEPVDCQITVESVVPLVVDFSYSVYIRQNYNIKDADAIDGIKSKLITFFSTSLISGWKKTAAQNPGKVYEDTLKQIISSAFPTAIYEVDITALTANGGTVLSVNGELPVLEEEVPVLGTITPDIKQVAI